MPPNQGIGPNDDQVWGSKIPSESVFLVTRHVDSVAKIPGTADLTLLSRQRSKTLNHGSRLTSAIIQNLPDVLLGDAKHLSQRGYRLTLSVAARISALRLHLGEVPL